MLATAIGHALVFVGVTGIFLLVLHDLLHPPTNPERHHPMKLNDIRSETAEVAVPFQSGDLHVTYRPNTFTADRSDAVQAAAKDEAKATDAMFLMVGDVLVRWDLEGDDGETIPLDDPKRLRAEVPVAVFGRIFAAIGQAQNPQVTARNSSAG